MEKNLFPITFIGLAVFIIYLVIAVYVIVFI